MILPIFTLFHVALSLVGILTGSVVVFGMFGDKRLDGWTKLFLWTTILTSVTGFMFPYHGFLPSYAVGSLSLLILAIAVFARYRRHMEGGWRRTYVISAVIAFYLNFFVLVVQLFKHVPALTALAPTQTEPAFKIAQLVVLVAFLVIAILASIRFRDAQSQVSQTRAA
jgi:hypothetical protein